MGQSRHFDRGPGPLPVYPDQRTSSDRPGMSGWCHFRTHASQQIAACSISSSGTSRAGLIRAVLLSESPQLAASSMIARRER